MVRVELKPQGSPELFAAVQEYERCFSNWMQASLSWYEEDDQYDPTDFLLAEMECAKVHMEHCQQRYLDSMDTLRNNRNAMTTKRVQ